MNRNQIEIAGRLTRDPELKYTPKGTALTEIGVAVNEVSGTGDERQETALFLDVTCWGTTAENVHKYLRKGDPLFIDGKLTMDHWEDKQTGAKRQKLKLVAFRITFLGSNKPKAEDRNPPQDQHHRGAQDPQLEPDQPGNIPF